MEEKRTTSSFPLQGEEVLQLHGGYGKDLMSEVYKYSLAGQAIARANDFDVIHAHDWMAYPAGILAKEATGKPLVCHVHATEADRSGSHMNDEIAHIEWEGMQRADKVVAVSHFTKNLIMRVYQVPEEKIVVVHNAVSRKDAGHIYHAEKPKGEKQVLFMGRVTFQKGPDYFVEAARLVLQVMPNVRFVMAGAGDMLLSMVTRVAKYRIGRRFTFTGFLKGDEVERMYAASDLYVMPSVSEPFGIAPLEAMVYDVPVLMSKQSGVSEVVNNAQGEPEAVLIDEPFDRAWRRVGVALDRAGFEVADRDRSQGIFMIRYLDPDYEAKMKSEQGFFTNLFSKAKAIDPVEYRLRLTPEGDKTRVTVLSLL